MLKRLFFPHCMVLGHCRKAVDHRYLDLFLESQFYCMDLYVYLAIITTLFWLLSIVISFESGRCDSLQPFFSNKFIIFWVSWISTWTLVVNFQVLQEKTFNILMGIVLNVLINVGNIAILIIFFDSMSIRCFSTHLDLFLLSTMLCSFL